MPVEGQLVFGQRFGGRTSASTVTSGRERGARSPAFDHPPALRGERVIGDLSQRRGRILGPPRMRPQARPDEFKPPARAATTFPRLSTSELAGNFKAQDPCQRVGNSVRVGACQIQSARLLSAASTKMRHGPQPSSPDPLLPKH